MNSPANYIDPNGTVPWSWQRNGETAVQYSMRMYNQDMYDMMYLGGVGIGGGGAMDKTKLSYLVQTGYIGTKYELYDYYIDYYSEPNGQGEKGGTRYMGSIWEPTNQVQGDGNWLNGNQSPNVIEYEGSLFYEVQAGDYIYKINKEVFGGRHKVADWLEWNADVKWGYDTKGNYVPLVYPGDILIVPPYFNEKLKQPHIPYEETEILINIMLDWFMKPVFGPLIEQLYPDQNHDINRDGI